MRGYTIEILKEIISGFNSEETHHKNTLVEIQKIFFEAVEKKDEQILNLLKDGLHYVVNRNEPKDMTSFYLGFLTAIYNTNKNIITKNKELQEVLHLTPKECTIMDFIESNPYATNGDINNMFSMQKNNTSNRIKRLLEKGFLNVYPSGKYRQYTLSLKGTKALESFRNRQQDHASSIDSSDYYDYIALKTNRIKTLSAVTYLDYNHSSHNYINSSLNHRTPRLELLEYYKLGLDNRSIESRYKDFSALNSKINLIRNKSNNTGVEVFIEVETKNSILSNRDSNPIPSSIRSTGGVWMQLLSKQQSDLDDTSIFNESKYPHIDNLFIDKYNTERAKNSEEQLCWA